MDESPDGSNEIFKFPYEAANQGLHVNPGNEK